MIINVNSIDLYYEKFGSGQPLILLHGNGGNHKIFNPAIKKLKEKFTVYAIDTRGHGRSGAASQLHYHDMAEDIIDFIEKLKLNKPILYGFSDGGIVAVMISIVRPELLSKVIASGVNIVPKGIKSSWLTTSKLIYTLTKSIKYKLALEEPNIPLRDLQQISIPVHLTAGSKDIIRKEHTQLIADNIPKCTLNIFEKESHSSYIAYSNKIADFIIEICR